MWNITEQEKEYLNSPAFKRYIFIITALVLAVGFIAGVVVSSWAMLISRM